MIFSDIGSSLTRSITIGFTAPLNKIILFIKKTKVHTSEMNIMIKDRFFFKYLLCRTP